MVTNTCVDIYQERPPCKLNDKSGGNATVDQPIPAEERHTDVSGHGRIGKDLVQTN